MSKKFFKFQVGHIYLESSGRSIVCEDRFEVIKRTPKTVTILKVNPYPHEEIKPETHRIEITRSFVDPKSEVDLAESISRYDELGFTKKHLNYVHADNDLERLGKEIPELLKSHSHKIPTKKCKFVCPEKMF